MASRRSMIFVLLAAAVVGAIAQPARAQAAESQKLFALDALQGSLTPVKGKPGVHRLVLEDVRARALSFTDRPVREVGTVALRRMLKELFAGNSSPPNAAVNATASKRGQLLMGVEIQAWNYDSADKRLTLRVRHLRQNGKRQTFQRVRNDVVLPRSFRDVSVFIDNCCGATTPGTVFNAGILDLSVSVNNGPTFNVPSATPPSWAAGSASLTFQASAPTPGVLGPGVNYVSVTPSGGISPVLITMNLPSAIPYGQVQLYLFQGTEQFSWSLLNDGQLVASGVVPVF